MQWLPDAYTWQARIAPVALALLPVVVIACGGVVWFDLTLPNFGGTFTPIAGILAVMGSSCVLFASNVGRHGRSKQELLFAKWGGPPLRRAMRRDFKGDDAMSWGRIVSRLEIRCQTPRPTVADENNDPATANQVYADYENELKRATRDSKQFPLVAAESRSFGFRRNLWAMKPLALVICLTLYLVTGSLAFWLSAPERWYFVGCNVFLMLVILVWWFVITPNWVHQAADAYVAAMRDSGLGLIQAEREKMAP